MRIDGIMPKKKAFRIIILVVFLCAEVFVWHRFVFPYCVISRQKEEMAQSNHFRIHRGYSNFLLNMAFISPSEVENIYIS